MRFEVRALGGVQFVAGVEHRERLNALAANAPPVLWRSFLHIFSRIVLRAVHNSPSNCARSLRVARMAVARAAAAKFSLDLIYFAPADIPPHKQKRPLTDFRHRFAMLALATAGDKRFVPSLIDAPTGQPNYSVDTVRRLKAKLKKSDRLYFLIGMDAFADIATWRDPVELLSQCEFIVAARPGYSLGQAARALPPALRPPEIRLGELSKRTGGTIAVPGARVHLLGSVASPVSSTAIRTAAGKSAAQLSRLVPSAVAEYIWKAHLYYDGPIRARAARTR
jgi:nicotinate-nucleotide adenylyltransferase